MKKDILIDIFFSLVVIFILILLAFFISGLYHEIVTSSICEKHKDDKKNPCAFEECMFKELESKYRSELVMRCRLLEEMG